MTNPMIVVALDNLHKHIDEAEQLICTDIDKLRAEIINLTRRVYELETKGRDE